MATHYSILAWRIPQTEEPGRLWSIVLQSWTQLKHASNSLYNLSKLTELPTNVAHMVEEKISFSQPDSSVLEF